jgi:hypothetical protein
MLILDRSNEFVAFRINVGELVRVKKWGMFVVYWLILKSAAQWVSEQMVFNGFVSVVWCEIRMLCGVSLAACYCMVCYAVDIFL